VSASAEAGALARKVQAATPRAAAPAGPRPHRLTVGCIGLYAFLVLAALFFLFPLVVMLLTSLKSMEEIRAGNLFSLPDQPSLEAWKKAWMSACTGLNCEGIPLWCACSLLPASTEACRGSCSFTLSSVFPS
jgi:ABC-type glycerol-3-phosphate transport system permease component